MAKSKGYKRGEGRHTIWRRSEEGKKKKGGGGGREGEGEGRRKRERRGRKGEGKMEKEEKEREKGDITCPRNSVSHFTIFHVLDVELIQRIIKSRIISENPKKILCLFPLTQSSCLHSLHGGSPLPCPQRSQPAYEKPPVSAVCATAL